MLFDKIKSNWIAARKAKDTVTSSTLTLVVDAVQKWEKEAKKQATDEDVVASIKGEIKSVDKEISSLKAKFPDNLPEDRIKELQTIVSIMDAYIPQSLTRDELKEVIETHIKLHPDQGDIRSIMGFLKENYANRYDGKMAKGIIDEITGK